MINHLSTTILFTLSASFVTANNSTDAKLTCLFRVVPGQITPTQAGIYFPATRNIDAVSSLAQKTLTMEVGGVKSFIDNLGTALSYAANSHPTSDTMLFVACDPNFSIAPATEVSEAFKAQQPHMHGSWHEYFLVGNVDIDENNSAQLNLIELVRKLRTLFLQGQSQDSISNVNHTLTFDIASLRSHINPDLNPLEYSFDLTNAEDEAQRRSFSKKLKEYIQSKGKDYRHHLAELIHVIFFQPEIAKCYDDKGAFEEKHKTITDLLGQLAPKENGINNLKLKALSKGLTGIRTQLNKCERGKKANINFASKKMIITEATRYIGTLLRAQ